jgi:tRNA A37 threonylcarbamoyladenosine dehydratase
MLARSGVGSLRLIDFDQVTLSSLNRHAVATMADVGLSKAVVMKNRLNSIVPWCSIDAATEMFIADSADRLLGDSPSCVVDCIDDLNTKAQLISYCIHHKIPIITSLGTLLLFPLDSRVGSFAPFLLFSFFSLMSFFHCFLHRCWC